MTRRPATETIEILRMTLLEMEADPYFDPVDLAELKRIILNRIAELEMDTAPNADDAIPSSTPPLAA